jgi:hypothetical protein
MQGQVGQDRNQGPQMLVKVLAAGAVFYIGLALVIFL